MDLPFLPEIFYPPSPFSDFSESSYLQGKQRWKRKICLVFKGLVIFNPEVGGGGGPQVRGVKNIWRPA